MPEPGWGPAVAAVCPLDIGDADHETKVVAELELSSLEKVERHIDTS